MRHTSWIDRVAVLVVISGLTSARADDVLIKTPDGATISAVVQLPEAGAGKVSTLLVFDIYTRPDEQKSQAGEFARRGYAGVIANVRGKYQSPDKPVPYEHDATDAYAVIDWISKQPWSDGKVGMIGGSYSGFTAWAANKRRHPALKAIAVSAAAIPGQGLPMQNNVFLSANYPWAFYVTNNKLLDEAVYADNARWSTMQRSWFQSGRPYRELDAIDGTPNPLLQRWLQHPTFDEYWQDMGPHGREFARINIPVLNITGYYDDGQISALKYFKEHVTQARDPEHYLVIGPYDHFGTHAREKPAVLREYALDPVAQLDTPALKLEFMDYVLRSAPKPKLLAGRVNYQVMGTNQWRHAPSLEAMHGIPMRLYFSAQKDEGLFSLPNRQPPSDSKVIHEVDFTDRVKFHHAHGYPGQIIQGPLQHVTESIFVSTPFASATSVTGAFSGELVLVINKRDFDLGVTVFEAMADGKLFFLGSGVQRASHVESPEKRRLLSPGKEARVTFQTSMVAKQMQPGSRLMVLVDAIKNPVWQINYGTGKDVSDESIEDAGEPLKIEIRSGSYFQVPLDNSITRPKI
jgi:putative CocE/NonD family hydrolase